MKTFGDRIRELRRERKLTQWEVADHTGVSNTYISALESGRKPAPPHAIVTALAACLQIGEEALWKLARSEREERLKLRIDGIPTSQRTTRSQPASIESPGAALLDDPLEQAVQTLKEGAASAKQRHSLALRLEKIAKNLRS